MYGIKDNADLKAHSVPAHINPGLENCIIKLITQYFCTCVIPLCDVMRGAEGIKVCCGPIKAEMGFAADFIVLLCICICSHVCMCMCQHPFLMSASFVCSLIQRPGESYFSIFES